MTGEYGKDQKLYAVRSMITTEVLYLVSDKKYSNIFIELFIWFFVIIPERTMFITLNA